MGYPPFLLSLLAATLALLSSALLSLAFIVLRRRGRLSGDLETAKVSAEPELAGEKTVVRRFRWAEIEAGTGGFREVVGEGGFSKVYLGRLAGVLAAVKVHRSSERLRREFRRELEVLLRVHHPNIVRLVGYSDDEDGDEGALAFELAPNGSLHDWLHGSGKAVLTWRRRTAIAYGVAVVVEYLHEGCDPQVVHGDIKASNVLLDAQMDPKLCDFGSAVMGFSSAVRPPTSTGRPAMTGSPGYVDPHYMRTGLLSKKSDVYSFGVLLLELLTGAEPFSSNSDRHLAATLAPLLRSGRAADVAPDPRLACEFDAEEAAAMAAVAGMCLGEQPSLRPSISEVVRMMREEVPSSSMTIWVVDGDK